MHLFYIDESGNTGANLDSADQPIHWLMALGLAPDTLPWHRADGDYHALRRQILRSAPEWLPIIRLRAAPPSG